MSWAARLTRTGIRARALERAATHLGPGHVEHVTERCIDVAMEAAFAAIDTTIDRALAQHRRTARTLDAPIEPVAPPARRRS